MKKYLQFTLMLFFTAVFFVLPSKKSVAQLTPENLKALIESKNYGFTVTHDTNGDFTSGNYYFHLMNDSLSTALPYHGNSGTAAYTVNDNGINIHTKDFSYQLKPLKNGGYFIKINLNNDRITRSFSLRVNKKGYTLLTVESINRDPVSFSGIINGI
jgi:hypothetical protein